MPTYDVRVCVLLGILGIDVNVHVRIHILVFDAKEDVAAVHSFAIMKMDVRIGVKIKIIDNST